MIQYERSLQACLDATQRKTLPGHDDVEVLKAKLEAAQRDNNQRVADEEACTRKTDDIV